jgi:serine phosphatase RsbU (regulator of sigma subunit)
VLAFPRGSGVLSRFRNSQSAPVVVEPAPTVFPQIAGADIAAVFTGKRVAGDFYDSIRTSPERVLIGLLDVAGRREDNRYILNHAQEIFRTSGVELFSKADINEADAMTDLCLRLNRGLIDICCGVHSCPAFIACYHEKFGTLCYTNAGHTPGLVRDHTGVSELPATGLPLGLFSHATTEAQTIGLENGAALLLVSLGLVECEGHSHGSRGTLGIDRIKQILQTTDTSTARSLCTAVVDTASQFGAKIPACDDRTALALVRNL